VLREELMEIRQRIHEGTLWEYLEAKARAHPSLYRFLKKLSKFRRYIEALDPETHPKPHGLFFYHDTSPSRPEPLRHFTRLENVDPPSKKALVVKASTKPYNRSWEYRYLKELVHIIFYDPVFGAVPEELAEVYPLSQNEAEGESEEARARLYEWLNRYDEIYTYGVDIPLVGKAVRRLSSIEDARYIA